MIINLRGTNGSGKTTVFRKVLLAYLRAGHEVWYEIPPGRRKSAGRYVAVDPRTGVQVWVLGSYGRATCGGTDQYPTMDLIEADVRAAHKRGAHVIFEGLLVSAVRERWLAVAKDCHPMEFFYLSTPLEDCIASTVGRRQAAGNEKAFNPANLTSKYHGVINCYKAMQARGIACRQVDRGEAALAILQLLDGPEPGEQSNANEQLQAISSLDQAARIAQEQ